MQRRPSKRKQATRLFLVYSFMTSTVIVTVTVLMLLILGYSFNRTDNRIEQGGLLQFASQPSGATVTLDELRLGAQTPSKSTADAKSHTATMNLTGYRTWRKTIDLSAGMIGWLSYARLIPTDPVATKLHTLPTLAGSLASPGRKWMALVEDAAQPVVVLADLSNDTVTYTTLTIPATKFTAPAEGKTQTFHLESWSNDEQRLLVKHTYDDNKIEWLVVDRGDITKTHNVTVELGLESDKVLFGSGNGQLLYAKTGDIVRRLDLGNLTLTRPLVSNVDDFSLYKFTTILYTTKPDPTTKLRTIGYLQDNMDTSEKLGSYPDDGQPLHLAMGDYFDVRYLAVTHGTQLTVSSGTLPRGAQKSTMKSLAATTLTGPAEQLTIGSTGRFVVAQVGSTYTTYDIELQKTDTTTLKGTATTSTLLGWIDPFMPWSDHDGMLRLYEFDGANQQDITPVAEGFDVTLSPNEKYLYSIAHEGTGFALQRVQLILK